MASWRDSLGQVTFPDGRVMIGASFRGVPFHVESAEFSGGRRTVKHEFPLRDVPYMEDTGRRARSFPVDGYVIGADYLARRDALIAALEEPGPGELVHPHFGKRRVALGGPFRVREATTDGGLARFSIEFEETEVAPSFPTAVAAPAANVAANGDRWEAEARTRLALRSAVSLPASALASVSDVIASAAEAMRAELAPLVAGTQELATLKRAIDNIILDADALARSPLRVLEDFSAALVAFRSPVTPPSGGVLALLNAYAFVPAAARPPATTATRVAEQEVYDLALGTIRTLLIVEAARMAVAGTYDSYDAAVAARDAICGPLDEQAAAADDESFAVLEQLRADLVRALPGEASDLPRLVSHAPAFTVPSLVLAHRLYGDLSLEADLVARNRVARPGFVVGGTEIKVLSRG
jgi:prophage DNA circulation protein